VQYCLFVVICWLFSVGVSAGGARFIKGFYFCILDVLELFVVEHPPYTMKIAYTTILFRPVTRLAKNNCNEQDQQMQLKKQQHNNTTTPRKQLENMQMEAAVICNESQTDNINDDISNTKSKQMYVLVCCVSTHFACYYFVCLFI